jgi:hypothetical protein
MTSFCSQTLLAFPFLPTEAQVCFCEGRELGRYLKIKAHAFLPDGFYLLEGNAGQLLAYQRRVIHFPLDQELQVRAYFFAREPHPTEVLICHPDGGNRSYASHTVVLDAGCTLEQLYHGLRHSPLLAGRLSSRLAERALYRLLWEIYFLEYPDLLRAAAEYDGFSNAPLSKASNLFRPQNNWQVGVGEHTPSSAFAVADAVWHYQHYAVWRIPPFHQRIAQQYWREISGEPFPSDQQRLEMLSPDNLVELSPGEADEIFSPAVQPA